MKNMNLEAMRNLDKLPLPVAKEVAKSWLVKPKKENSIYRYNNLLLDIERSPSSEKLMLTMWNVILAGDGLAVPNSRWQQDHARHLYT
jgi:hypothetical protein